MSRYFDREGNPMTLSEWAYAFERERHIGQDGIGEVRVSTVWLGLDHRFGEGPPLIFETMIFGGPQDNWQERYSTEEEALTGHRRVVEALRSGAEL